MAIDRDKRAQRLAVGNAFSPGAPIDRQALFAGRVKQIREVVDAIIQRGQHVVVFGERGVGKTSLANVIADITGGSPEERVSLKINCDSTDDFSSLWHKIFREIALDVPKRALGFAKETKTVKVGLVFLLI